MDMKSALHMTASGIAMAGAVLFAAVVESAHLSAGPSSGFWLAAATEPAPARELELLNSETIRILLIVPHVGTRTAELMEAPVMFVVTILAAHWVVRHLAISPMPLRRLAVGFIALGLLLAAEFAVILALQGLTIADYLASRDPVAGTV